MPEEEENLLNNFVDHILYKKLIRDVEVLKIGQYVRYFNLRRFFDLKLCRGGTVIDVDFEDVNTVMRNAGAAVIGSATASGENRANRAAEMAINSPLLNNHEIYGAKKILLNIVSGEEDEINMNELKNIT